MENHRGVNMKKGLFSTFRLIFLPIFAIAFMAAAIRSEQNPDARLDVEDLVTEAIANNPAVRAAWQEQRAASMMARPAGTLPDPTLGFGLE